MTTNEFSNEFDILFNNISSNQAPGLDEYEKSVFLTQAQEAVVLDLYKGTLGNSFEETEETTRYLNSLVRNYTYENSGTGKTVAIEIAEISELLFITYQSAIIDVDDKDRDVLVVPTTQDNLYKDLRNPFRMPNKNRILCTSEGNDIILYSNFPIKSYSMKYLKKPTPIILEDLPSELTVGGLNEKTECELNPALHKAILLRAVQMANLSMGLTETGR